MAPGKTAILFHELRNRGGAERIVILMAKLLDADIYTGRWFKEQTYPEFKKLRVHSFNCSINNRLANLYIRKKFSNLNLTEYDTVIVHGGSTLAAQHPNIIWYCHAPTRWLYDLYEDEKKKFKPLKRALFIMMATRLRNDDLHCVQRVNTIIANSKFTQQRVKKYYGRDSIIINPPVNLNDFHFTKRKARGDFFLSTARLDPIKRVDLIIQAFKELPKERLVIASGGPDEERLRSMAKECRNINFLGWISDEELHSLLGECRATIYMGYQEDFGMCPVESMASGKPCIATNEGGLRETIINNKTGYLIKPTAEAIEKAVRKLTKEKAALMRAACEKRAKQFSEDKFTKKLLEVLK